MFNKRLVDCTKITSPLLETTILESGNIGEINQGIFRINQLSGNNLEPTALNVYLRVENENVDFTRMIGVGSPSTYEIIDNKVIYKGSFKDVKYSVVFTLAENCFFFDVKINNENANSKVSFIICNSIFICNSYIHTIE